MIVQHPMLWCAAFLVAGIAVGLNFPLPYYLPLLAIMVIACTLLRKTRHLHDVLTLLVWFLLGCSRAAIGNGEDSKSPFNGNNENGFSSARSALVARLERSGVSQKTLALTSALTVGKKDGLEYETKEAYRKVGAGHLLALSGLHLGIVYGALYLVFIGWVRHTHWRWFALPVILAFLWGYTLIAGMPVSLVRAALMLSIFTILSLMQYDTDPLHVLALSAIIILLIAPTDLLSVSFQLSFSAVFFILALWRPIQDSLPKLHWTVRLLAVSFVATLGTMPFVCYYFHRLPLLGPFLSLILIPLTTVIIYLTLAAMAFPFSFLGQTLNFAVSLQERILDFSGSIPHSILNGLYPSKTIVALMYGAMLMAIIRLRTRENA